MMKFLIIAILTFVLAANLLAQDTIQKKITVLTPSDGAIWKPGTTETVEWTSNNLDGNVHIRLSTDGGSTFNIMLQPNVPGDSSQSILVPEIFSTQCVIKVESIDNDKIFGLSSGNFTISEDPSITVAAPGVDSKWIAGTEESVAWVSENLNGNVNILLSTDGGISFPLTLLYDIPNDGAETVLVPDNPSAASVIRVESAENNNIFGLSAAFVIESAPPFISVTEPSVSSNWITGSQQNVAWSSGSISGSINIKVSIDGGTTFPVTLQENIQNDGLETVLVPDVPSSTAVIRVESFENNNVFGLSGTFIIASGPSITVTEPSASSNWKAGTEQHVTWSSVNITGSINIKLSTDGGTTFPVTLQANIQNDGIETIQVPDNPSASSVIRVESSEDNNIFGLSETFNIESAPSVTVIEPSASSNWIAGTQQNIVWSSINQSGNINIKLSIDGGISFPFILKSDTPDDGSESVQIPETASSLSVIKVESATDNSIFGLSATFSIGSKPSITVSEPSASANWIAGTAQNVVWSSVNVSGNVSIRLSTDGGASFPVTLLENIQNDGSELIQVPDAQSSSGMIKVESVSDNNVFGLSEFFSIEAKPSITVTEPTASSNWIAGTQQNVAWTSVNVQGNVNIKLSVDGGITFAVTLKSNTSNDGTEIVDVPNIASLAGVIKVESAADNSVSGASQGSFLIIVPVITVISPAAGVNWPVGSRQTITWESENIIGIVNIKLSFDGGSTFPVTLRSNSINDGRENITVPDNPSANCVVRIESSVYNDFFGLSKGTFSIVHSPQITVVTPSAAANWTIGSQQSVTWTSVNIAGDVNIKLSTDGGSTFPVTLKSNTKNDGTEKVEVPDNPSSNCLVKIEAAADNSIFSISEGTFTITYAPTISVTKPESGENWITGTQQIVTWTSVNVLGNINIKLSLDGGNTFSISLGTNIPNDGIETIQVTDNQSVECRIKIESVADVNVYGMNPGEFSISPVPAIQITQPVQAANWVIGTQQAVSWSSQNLNGNVNIVLSTDGGNTFPVVLKSNTSNDGSEIIDVPNNPSQTSRIKIESAADKNIFGLNPGNFTILTESAIIVTSPLHSANWTIGSHQTVSWTSVNVTGNVNIKLSTDGGNTFPIVLKSNTSNDGSEIVDVPAKPSQIARVKVESTADTNIFGVNPGNINITPEPAITVTSPFQSANWTIGSEQTVTWNSVNVTGNVKIKLSIDGGNTFPVTLKNSTGNDGSEKITVPGNQSQTCRVKVESAADSNIFGINPGNFTITSEPTITVISPTSSVNWTIGSEQTVEWNSVNVTGNVNVRLSTDGGNTFPVTLKTDTRNDGSEKITVPDNKSQLCRIKIESVSDTNIFGLNPGNFTITSEPTILVTAPLQSAKWMTGSQQSVSWNSVNVSGNVTIKLSTDAGSTFPVILKSGTVNDGSESVTVPGNTSSSCRIRVESVNDNGIFGLNPGNFEITSGPTISVIQPAASVVWPAGSQQSVTWNSGNISF